MSRRKSVWLGIVILLVAVVISVVGPTSAMGCAPSRPTDFHHDDGKWFVLIGQGCTHGDVVTYSGQWRENERTNVERRINTSDGYHPNIALFAPASNDGWWFVSTNDRAYRLSPDFEYENRTRTLPFDTDGYLTGMAIDEQGRWWITTRTMTTVYKPEDDETVQTFRKGASDIVVRDNRAVLLRSGQKGGIVREYDIRKTSEGTLTLNQRARHELGPEVFHPRMISQKPDGGWWIYSRYGSRLAYDQSWRYTGEHHPRAAVIHGLFFLFPALFVSFIVFWPVAWRVTMGEVSRRLLSIYVGSGLLAALLAVSVRESLMPPSLAFVYWPPDQFVGGLLLGPTALGLYILEKRSWKRVVLVVVANLPLLVVAWDFFTSVR